MADNIKDHFVNFEGNRIFCRLINQKHLKENSSLLLFLHEGLGCTALWKDFPELLGNELQLPCLLYDRPGYGKSDGLKGKHNADFMEKEAFQVLPSVLEGLGLQNELILFGHSDGGTIALIYATQFSDRVKCVITEAAHIFVEITTLKGIQATCDCYMEGPLYRNLRTYHGGNTESMFKAWSDIWLSETFRNWNIAGSLSGIKAPLLVIQGEKDEYGTTAQPKGILANTGGPADAFIVPDCGHIPHIQAAEAVLQRVKEYIVSV